MNKKVTDKKAKPKKTSRKDEPLNIPLDFEEVLESLLQAKPPKEKSKPKK